MFKSAWLIFNLNQFYVANSTGDYCTKYYSWQLLKLPPIVNFKAVTWNCVYLFLLFMSLSKHCSLCGRPSVYLPYGIARLPFVNFRLNKFYRVGFESGYQFENENENEEMQSDAIKLITNVRRKMLPHPQKRTADRISHNVKELRR